MVHTTSLPGTWLFSGSRGKEVAKSLTGIVLVGGGSDWYLPGKVMFAIYFTESCTSLSQDGNVGNGSN